MLGLGFAELGFSAIVSGVSLLRFFRERHQHSSGSQPVVSQLTPSLIRNMKADLVNAASEVIPNQQILVNIVSRRVRQLCIGHRPLVEFSPGLGHADIALTEIANGKLTFESTFGHNGNGKDGSAPVVQFPGVIVTKTKKKAA